MAEPSKPKHVEPKKAAACIIMDPSGRILMVRRSPELRFMPGHHAFPGGRVGDTETGELVTNAENAAMAKAVKAAAREVFEETGLLLAEGPIPNLDARRTARQELLEEKADFDTILSSFGGHIDASKYEVVANWI